MRPAPTRNGEGLEKASRGLVEGFAAGTGGTGCHTLPSSSSDCLHIRNWRLTLPSEDETIASAAIPGVVKT